MSWKCNYCGLEVNRHDLGHAGCESEIDRLKATVKELQEKCSHSLIGMHKLGDLVNEGVSRIRELEEALNVNTKLLRGASQRLYSQGFDESSEELEKLLRNIDQLQIKSTLCTPDN